MRNERSRVRNNRLRQFDKTRVLAIGAKIDDSRRIQLLLQLVHCIGRLQVHRAPLLHCRFSCDCFGNLIAMFHNGLENVSPELMVEHKLDLEAHCRQFLRVQNRILHALSLVANVDIGLKDLRAELGDELANFALCPHHQRRVVDWARLEIVIELLGCLAYVIEKGAAELCCIQSQASCWFNRLV